MNELSRSRPGRLSRPAAAPLTAAVAASLADRIAQEGGTAPEPGGLYAAVATLSDAAFLQLARHALDAALEALDSRPALTADLLPATASTVRAQIARGCIGEQGLGRDEYQGGPGYVVAEIDFEVWEKLLEADLRAAPLNSLDPRESAARRSGALRELGIGEADVNRYRDDGRVALAVSSDTSLLLDRRTSVRTDGHPAGVAPPR